MTTKFTHNPQLNIWTSAGYIIKPEGIEVNIYARTNSGDKGELVCSMFTVQAAKSYVVELESDD